MSDRTPSIEEIRSFGIQEGPFEPTYESLSRFECPEWFRDAKLGIWAHWGPQSVPMCGDWYARSIYMEGGDQYRFHWRTYGHPSKVGFKDIVPMWKAERFDPDALMDLYVAAGAKYFVAQAAHHDNFDNWNSKHHRWNAVKMGPQKDIVGLWRDAARDRGLRFGVTEHLGATFKWYAITKQSDTTGPYAGVPYDGSDPAYEDFYLPNHGEELGSGWPENGWYTRNPWWHQRWFNRIKDLVDQYEPDLLYSDGEVPFGDVGLNIIAHLYNSSVARQGANEAVYNQKNRDSIVRRVGVLDLERHVEGDVVPYVWQTDTCVGGWFYNTRQTYKTPQHVIEMLVDIVSKNGNLLLNLPQRPDGTLDDECMHIVRSMAAWIKVNGEGIYGTRPWSIACEGPTVPEKGEGEIHWSSGDFRFTVKGDVLYAFQMKWPEDGKALIRSLSPYSGRKVENVGLLGFEEALRYEQRDHGLYISLPQEKPCEYAHCFRVHLRETG